MESGSWMCVLLRSEAERFFKQSLDRSTGHCGAEGGLQGNEKTCFTLQAPAVWVGREASLHAEEFMEGLKERGAGVQVVGVSEDQPSRRDGGNGSLTTRFLKFKLTSYLILPFLVVSKINIFKKFN